MINIFDCDVNSLVGKVLDINIVEFCCFILRKGDDECFFCCDRIVSDLFDMCEFFFIELMFKEVMDCSINEEGDEINFLCKEDLFFCWIGFDFGWNIIENDCYEDFRNMDLK